jgi:hypothetical protein
VPILQRPTLVICPGVHPPELTANLLQALGAGWPVTLLPADNMVSECSMPTWGIRPLIPYRLLPSECLPYNPIGVLSWLQAKVSPVTPLVFLGFSAGVVGGLGAALAWQHSGGTVLSFLAVDGWGVPLPGEFPVHRLSHDEFTHWSCLLLDRLLGSESASFYADPAVDHWQLWEAPQRVRGCWVKPERGIKDSIPAGEKIPVGLPAKTSALEVLRVLLRHYCLA